MVNGSIRSCQALSYFFDFMGMQNYQVSFPKEDVL